MENWPGRSILTGNESAYLHAVSRARSDDEGAEEVKAEFCGRQRTTWSRNTTRGVPRPS